MALKDNWVLWLGFDDTASPLRDQTGNNPVGTTVGGGFTFIPSGGKPLSYITTGGAIQIIDANILSFVGAPASTFFTMHCWVNVSSFSATNYVFYKRTDSGTLEYHMNILSTGSVNIQTWTSTGNTSVSNSGAGLVTLSTWVHIVAVWNGTNMLFYKNGSLFSTISPTITGTYTGMVNTISNLYVIGNNVGASPVVGSVDNAALRNIITTATEVSMLYNGGQGLNPFKSSGTAMMAFF